jgi:hypothetical protein
VGIAPADIFLRLEKFSITNSVRFYCTVLYHCEKRESSSSGGCSTHATSRNQRKPGNLDISELMSDFPETYTAAARSHGNGNLRKLNVEPPPFEIEALKLADVTFQFNMSRVSGFPSFRPEATRKPAETNENPEYKSNINCQIADGLRDKYPPLSQFCLVIVTVAWFSQFPHFVSHCMQGTLAG